MTRMNFKPPAETKEVEIQLGQLMLPGLLYLPEAARGIVMFIHGSGSSRHSPRNKAVAQGLQQANFGTLLFDLLTPKEESYDLQTAGFRFDIPFLSRRVVQVTGWLRKQRETSDLPIGYLGASTGAAAALVAASQLTDDVQAVVSRGGRPDLAGDALAHVHAPTLFIVGGDDTQVIDLNEQAIVQMRCEREMKIIPGATHLFEESGALERVTWLARGWFKRFLGTHAVP